MKSWKPDTCECHIEEVYSGNTIVGGGQVLYKCPNHTSIPDNELYDVLLNKENRPKNRIQSQLMTSFPTLFTETDVVSGTVMWKRGISFNWAWSGTANNRVITITTPGVTLSRQQREAAQSWCDTNIGVGKVVIT